MLKSSRTIERACAAAKDGSRGHPAQRNARVAVLVARLSLLCVARLPVYLRLKRQPLRIAHKAPQRIFFANGDEQHRHAMGLLQPFRDDARQQLAVVSVVARRVRQKRAPAFEAQGGARTGHLRLR